MSKICASSLTGDLAVGFFITDMLMLCFGKLGNNLTTTRVLHRDGCKIGSDDTTSSDHSCWHNT